MDSLLSGTECRTRGRALRRAAQCMAAALLCMLLLCACDPYNGYRPYDYGEARWTCEEYGAWFEIKEKEAIYGEVMVDGKAVEVEYAFYPGGLIYIWPRSTRTTRRSCSCGRSWTRNPPPEGGGARGPFFEERRILTNGARKVYNLHAAGFPCFGTGPVGGNAGKPVWKGSGHL